MSFVRREPILFILLAMVVLSAVVALLAGAAVAAAAGGAALVLVVWLIERASIRLGDRGSFAHGLLVGLAGMVVRLAVVLGALVAVGVLADRATFTAAVVSFVAAYTVYVFARLWRHPAVSPSH
jgi:hypothetical protein